jgi:hypothetical protein
MFSPINRRAFVTTSLGAGALAALGDFSFLGGLPPVGAADAKLSPNVVQLSPDMEPLVRLIEETPRDKLLEVAAAKVRAGTNYQQLLGACLLAGVRGIKPRPVGFQFHAVLVINSAHLAALAAPDSDRWLPLFWALDNFKASQATNKQQNAGWMMPPVNEAKLPSATEAKKRFIEAMDNWDEEGADLAVTSLVRSAGANEVFELFLRYGARDFRDIGHKAIYVANSMRTLKTIGWRHAEPVMRSLAFALLEHSARDGNPAKNDLEADRPGRDNLKRLTKIKPEWQGGKVTPEATVELLDTLRTADHAGACDKVVELLNKGVSPASIWDALFLGAGELLMRQPGIVALHSVTSANALHVAYQYSGDDEMRRLAMLQCAAFLPLFRKAMAGRGKIEEKLKIDALEKIEPKAGGEGAIEEVFADVRKNNASAAGKTLSLLADKGANAESLIDAARRLIFTKGRDSHDYKFSSAALEDFYHTTPAWRPRFLASSMFWLHGSGEKDNDLITRARAALAKA